MANAKEQVLTGGRIVGPDAVFDGTVLVRDGLIADVASGRSAAAGALDLEGDYLIPGLVELHTDNLERHLEPRPGVAWPARPAVAAHDAEFAAQGVTTVLDALRVGVLSADRIGDYAGEALAALDALRDCDLLRADHYLHIRCEICAPTVLPEFDAIAPHARLRLISLMDHTIGQRQFRREDRYREYYLGKQGLSEAALDAFIAQSKELQTAYAAAHRVALVDRAAAARAQGGFCAVAGHDDGAPEDVAESVAAGATVSEFPTTLEAARLCRAEGQKVMMGAPNLLRGLSHSGNVSAMALADEGLVDILSSDYAPASLLMAAFKLGEETDYGLPDALATVTRTPALAVGLEDRGAIRPGLRADLAQVRRAEGFCAPRAAWSAGRRVG